MSFDSEKITFFARTDARGRDVQFGIKAKDRQRHVYVIGKTGMGKSTLLENMAVQDIQNGEGMAFIDPHGRSAETLLNYIPEHRVKDVLYFAPFDTECPVSFNIMEDVGPDKRHLVVSGLMSVFKKIWVDAWSARMEYILANTLLALLEYPGSTLLGVNRMLSDKDYRKLVVDNVKDPGVKAFWVDEFAKYNERYMQEAGDAIKNKIGQFTSNPIIRNIVGQPKSSFDIRAMMDEKKILIMNLSKGLIGESNANLLGSMLTTRIYLAAMSRADLSPEKMDAMPNFYFYVDEFQSFANATFANILSEARKYHLNLTIAHQYIEQMEEEVRNAVFGNVGTVIAFRVGPFDAEVLETIFTPQFLATDIVNLSFAQIYLTLMIDGIGSQPFSATTLPPIAPPVASCRDMTIASSRVQFTRPRAEVEELIHKFHEPVVLPKKVEKTAIPQAVSGAVRDREPARVSPRSSSPATQTAPVSKEIAQASSERREQPTERSVERPAVRPTERRQETPAVRSAQPVRTQSPARTNVAPSRPTEERRAPERGESKKQVEDLRSVLKRIVSSSESEKVENTAVRPLEKNKERGERTDLRSAISSVLAQKVETETPQDKVVVSDTKEIPPMVTATNEPKIEEMQEDVRPVFEQKPDAMSPKELERMMRVTTSDKPPV
jgi:energy-coupling factor transporter ATP-binding protein EcfA2